MCWHGEILTLDEYRKEIEDIKKLELEELQNVEDDIFEVILQFREDEDLNGYGIEHNIFKKFSSVRKFIISVSGSFYADDFGEAPKNRAYWKVSRYKMGNDDYELYCDYYFSLDMELLKIYYNPRFELEEKENYNYLLNSPKKITVPYKTGDIIKINNVPFHDDFYAVYIDARENGGYIQDEKGRYLNIYHWSIFNSEDLERLWIGEMSENSFGDNYLFNCPLIKTEIVTNCPDEKLMKASEKLKENSGLRERFLKKYFRDGFLHKIVSIEEFLLGEEN